MKLGPLLVAKYADYVPVFPVQQRTAAQRAGISFEKAVQKRLQLLHKKVEPGPWLYYKSARKSGVCQPDALLWLADDHICIVEIKLSWMRPARKKLLDFYGPIVQAMYPEARLSFLQIYKNAKPQSHKKPISMYALGGLPINKYKECQWLGL